jgi:hypothetical protein
VTDPPPGIGVTIGGDGKVCESGANCSIHKYEKSVDEALNGAGDDTQLKPRLRQEPQPTTTPADPHGDGGGGAHCVTMNEPLVTTGPPPTSTTTPVPTTTTTAPTTTTTNPPT